MDRLPIDITLRLPPVEPTARTGAPLDNESPASSFQSHLDRAAGTEASPPRRDDRPAPSQPADNGSRQTWRRDERSERRESSATAQETEPAVPVAEAQHEAPAPPAPDSAHDAPRASREKPGRGRGRSERTAEANRAEQPSLEETKAEADAQKTPIQKKPTKPTAKTTDKAPPASTGSKPSADGDKPAAPAATAVAATAETPAVVTEAQLELPTDAVATAETAESTTEKTNAKSPPKPKAPAAGAASKAAPRSDASEAPATPATDETAEQRQSDLEGQSGNDRGGRPDRPRAARGNAAEAAPSTTVGKLTAALEPVAAPQAITIDAAATSPDAPQSVADQTTVDPTTAKTAQPEPTAAKPAGAPALVAEPSGASRPAMATDKHSTRVAGADTASGVDRARFVQRVARAFQQASPDGGVVRLRLSPPELGSLRIEISVRGGTLTARVEAETTVARTALLESLPVLRDRLAEQQMKIDRFDVDLMQNSPQGSPRQPFDDADASGSARNRPRVVRADTPATETNSVPHRAAIEDGRLNVII